MRYAFVLLITCLFCDISYAQSSKRTKVGVFGNGAGLNFNYDPVQVFSVPSSPFGGFESSEGCAAIGDFDGNLLFYTDGVYVYNRKHEVMPNGSSINGGNDYFPTSSTQVLIVPFPKDPFRYYIISAKQQGEALHYSVVDIRLNGGYGALVEKAKLIYSPATEKMCIVKHASGEALWLIGHEMGTNNFRANLITDQGIDLNSVISSAGLNHYIDEIGANSIGYLKPSHDGKLLACAIAGEIGGFEYFKFDAATGVVSDGLLLIDGYPGLPYGTEFSPDNTKLYVSHLLTSELYQFDLTAEDVVGSRTRIGENIECALQLAPDGKIYAIGRRSSISITDTLDVINSPNEKGVSCNYEKNALYLKGKVAYAGLPEFVMDVVDPLIFHSQYCSGQPIEFKLTNLSGYTSLDWNFDDEGSGAANTSKGFSPTHVYKNPGIYRVKIVAHYADGSSVNYEQNVSVLPAPKLELGSDTVICYQQAITIKPQTDHSTQRIVWYDGSSDVSKTIGHEGLFRVTAYNDACIARDSIRISILKTPTFVLRDTSICYNANLKVELPPGLTYSWSDGVTGSFRFVNQPQTYTVVGKNRCETRSSKFTLSHVPRLLSNLPNDTILCAGRTLPLDVFNADASYRWHDDITESTRLVESPGTYAVEILNRCEAIRDTVTVSYDDKIDYEIPNVITANGDGFNDTFVIDDRLGDAALSIFDRWGKKIFYQNRYDNSWTGPGDSGIYFYSAETHCSVKKGWLHVVVGH